MEVKLTRDVYVQAAPADGVITVEGAAGDVVDAGPLAAMLVSEGAAEEAPKRQQGRKAAAK